MFKVWAKHLAALQSPRSRLVIPHRIPAAPCVEQHPQPTNILNSQQLLCVLIPFAPSCVEKCLKSCVLCIKNKASRDLRSGPPKIHLPSHRIPSRVCDKINLFTNAANPAKSEHNFRCGDSFSFFFLFFLPRSRF